jgi:tetratricopeptide (TPR) repeat protein
MVISVEFTPSDSAIATYQLFYLQAYLKNIQTLAEQDKAIPLIIENLEQNLASLPIENHSEAFILHLTLAEAYYASSNLEAAALQLATLLGLNHARTGKLQIIQALTLLSRINTDTGNYTEARCHLTSALKLASNLESNKLLLAQIFHELGMLSLKQDQSDLAMKYLNKALSFMGYQQDI